MSENPEFVYVLQLKQNKFYVGYTQNLYYRLHQHVQGVGSKWTQLYPPIDVLVVRPGGRLLENALAALYISRFGWTNVRGGDWCVVDGTVPPKFLSLHPNDVKKIEERKKN